MKCDGPELDKAKEWLDEYLSSSGLSLSEKQVNSVIDKCCKEPGSKPCIAAILAVVASEVCDSYTGNVCEPCCEKLGNIIAPVVAEGAVLAGAILSGAWDSITFGIFKKGCSYKKAGDSIVDASVASFDELTRSLKILNGGKELVPYHKSSGKLWSIGPGLDGKIEGIVGIDAVILHDAIVYYRVARERLYHTTGAVVIDQGSYGSYVGPNLNYGSTVSHYFSFSWKNTPCSDAGKNAWMKAAQAFQEIAWNAVNKARNQIVMELVKQATKKPGFRKLGLKNLKMTRPIDMGLKMTRPIDMVEARKILVTACKNVTGEHANQAMLQIIGAIGKFEGNYGHSKATNNWGGIQASCKSEHSVPYTDTHADGSEYQACLRTYDTPLDGASDLVRLLTIKRPNVWAAMKRGNAMLTAEEMRKTGYFEAPVMKYGNAIYIRAKQFAEANQEKLRVNRGSSNAQKLVSRSLIPVFLALGALVAAKRHR